jgi:hypothetical protein
MPPAMAIVSRASCLKGDWLKDVLVSVFMSKVRLAHVLMSSSCLNCYWLKDVQALI